MSELEGYLSISDLLNKGEKLLQEGKKEYINYEVDSYCMSILLFTSGTTAKSKAVMLSQNNIASNVNKKNETTSLTKQYFEYNLSFVPI